ncbi:hypothetical protein GW750_03675 [bacterium]|nr:hypothetical protein [bacterium]
MGDTNTQRGFITDRTSIKGQQKELTFTEKARILIEKAFHFEPINQKRKEIEKLNKEAATRAGYNRKLESNDT